MVFHRLTVSDIWSLCLPLTEAIKLNLRLLRKRELIVLLLLYSVDVMFLLSFFVSSSRSLISDCCISWLNSLTDSYMIKKIISEYDREIPQLQTADNPWHRKEEPLNHHETPGRQIKQSNQLSHPHQDDCNTRMDIK